METAKLFMNGRSQAVRLPKKYAFSGKEVYVKKVGGIVVLIPRSDDPRQYFLDSLEKFSGDVFDFERNQGSLETREPVG